VKAVNVSVVLPFYNAERTLEKAIRSILGQTLTDFELILFDDGSEDESRLIAEKASCSDSRVRAFSHKHAGIVTTLNEAVEVSSGSLIARMDADDCALPQRLERQANLLDSQPEVGLCGTQVRFFGSTIRQGLVRYQNWINNLVTHEEIMRDLFIECPLPHPTFMFRRETWENLGGYKEVSWPEDYDFCMRSVIKGWKLAKVPEVLLLWRDSQTRLSRTSDRYSPKEFRNLKRFYLQAMGFFRKERTLVQWGAGEVGKLWLREWITPRPSAVVDINPRKIGCVIHGFPVISPAELKTVSEVFVVVAVGAPGARNEIRTWLNENGYRECLDYVFVA